MDPFALGNPKKAGLGSVPRLCGLHPQRFLGQAGLRTDPISILRGFWDWAGLGTDPGGGWTGAPRFLPHDPTIPWSSTALP